MKTYAARLLASVCLPSIGLALTATPALAQDNTENEEVITVTGFRASLESAAGIKRDAIGVVDAITAEDIGKFPDANLAESLQRIPGVSIDRANNEGNQVTVRGFGPSFNLVTLNGRQMPNSSSLASEGVSRSFNFRELGSEGVSAVEVYKSGQADIYSGGIGATVNIKTPRPFDKPGFRAALSAKAVYDTGVEVGSEITPELSALVSQTFADDRLGVLLTASYAERNSHTDRIGTSGGWRRNRAPRGTAGIDLSAIDTSVNPSQTFWMPFTIDQDLWDTNRERFNAQAVVQAEPFDGLELTFDYTMSRFEQTTQMNRMSFWFDSPDQAVADRNGTLVDITTFNDTLNYWAWDFYHKGENDSIGANLEWEISDRLSLEVDAHSSTSKSNPDGQTSETLVDLFTLDRNTTGTDLYNGANVITLFGTFSDGLPTATYDDSAIPGGAFNKANIGSDLYQKRGFTMDNNIKQVRAAFSFDATPQLNLKVGGDYTKYSVDTARYATFVGLTQPTTFVPLDNVDLTFVDAKNPNVFPQIPVYRVEDFLDVIRERGTFTENPPTFNGIEEQTYSAFGMVEYDGDLGGVPFRANAGLRYEKTDVESYSVAEGISGFLFFNPQGLQTVFDGVVAPQTLNSDYDHFLPNFAFSVEPAEDFIIRGGYSKTIARSNISSMFPGLSISGRPGGPFTSSQGNPGLLPYSSDNLDFAAEWYYSPGSYVSVGVFKKWVDNFIGSVRTQGSVLNSSGSPITDPSINPRPNCPNTDPATNQQCVSQAGDPVVTFEISTTGNLNSESVQGLEASIQHMFGDTGFGVILNGTLVDGSVEYDIYDVSGTTIALTGLSNSANAVAFYEKDGIQARVSYNWRDKFLLGFAGGNEPVFTEAYGQVDVSASYDVNEMITVFVEGINVTDEETRRHGRFAEQLIDQEAFGARYTLGVRVKFQ